MQKDCANVVILLEQEANQRGSDLNNISGHKKGAHKAGKLGNKVVTLFA